MTIIDSQVHVYEANTPSRPWHSVPNWPDHVTGDEMVRKIDQKVRERVRALPEIADSGVELDALAKMEPQQQRKAVALVENGQASGIRDARRLMKAKAKVRPAPAQQADGAGRQCRREAFARAWAALDEVDREWARIDVISEKGAQA